MSPAIPAQPLAPQLQAFQNKFLASASEQIRTSLATTSASFAQSNPVQPLPVGARAPDFTLPRADGSAVSLSALLEQHEAVVLTWYRGGWCPYCNLTLRHLTRAVPQFERLGAKLVALTPETPDESLSTAQKNELNFEVLTDDASLVADKYGIMFEVPDDIRTLYKGLVVDLDSSNGNDGKRKPRLPLPATYVIDKKGVIQYAFADLDYTKRAEPSDVQEVLKKMAQ